MLVKKISWKNIPTFKIGTLPQTSPILLEFVQWTELDSIVVSVFVVDVLVEMTNTVFVNSTKTSTNTETAMLSRLISN